MTAKRYGVSFGDDKNILKWIVSMIDNTVNILKATESYILNERIV